METEIKEKKIIIDGIIKSQKDDRYCFSIRCQTQEDAQFWKDIINQVIETTDTIAEIQSCYFDTEEMKQLCVV